MAEGVTVVEVTTSGDMQIDDALVEVVEYDDARGVQIRICTTAKGEQLLRGLEDAEDVIDEPARLGTWHDTTVGRWRGLALRA
ncbi:hypothetical protein D0Z08_15160 [Nocardioides immobilis]|uniref:Uncharacterized protein n=1 Tax=Nocardioides immobilis TaxID=2049295 RepID=A0A417Y152_9ACTN|nr:hypothetical protein D0Z08_15160 [Nocardioides immobilis]